MCSFNNSYIILSHWLGIRPCHLTFPMNDALSGESNISRSQIFPLFRVFQLSHPRGVTSDGGLARACMPCQCTDHTWSFRSQAAALQLVKALFWVFREGTISIEESGPTREHDSKAEICTYFKTSVRYRIWITLLVLRKARFYFWRLERR